MWWVWQSMVKVFTPSSRTVNPAGTLGNSMLLAETLQLITTTSVLDQGETLVFTHVP